jgi:hypothetical protein
MNYKYFADWSVTFPVVMISVFVDSFPNLTSQLEMC